MTIFKEENKDKRNRPNAGVIIYSLLIYLLEFALVVSQTNYDKFIWRNLSDYFVGEHPA